MCFPRWPMLLMFVGNNATETCLYRNARCCRNNTGTGQLSQGLRLRKRCSFLLCSQVKKNSICEFGNSWQGISVSASLILSFVYIELEPSLLSYVWLVKYILKRFHYDFSFGNLYCCIWTAGGKLLKVLILIVIMED